MSLKPAYTSGIGIGALAGSACIAIILAMYFFNQAWLLSWPSGVYMLMCVVAMIFGVRVCYRKSAPDYSLVAISLGVFLIYAIAQLCVEMTYSALYIFDAEFLDFYKETTKAQFRETYASMYKETELRNYDEVVDTTHPAALGEIIMRFGLRLLPGLAMSFIIAMLYRIYKNRSTL